MRNLILKTLGLTVMLTGLWAGSAQAIVLYDQMSPPAIESSVRSDDFGPMQDALDRIVADDFLVPAGQTWNVTSIDVLGFYNGNPPPTVHVRIYTDNAGEPGTLLFQQLNSATTNGPDYMVPVAGVPLLATGHYWVSIQQTGATQGQNTNVWNWSRRAGDAPGTDPAVAGDPNNPMGCAVWTTVANCLDSNSSDVLFRINGNFPTPGTNPTPPSCIQLSAAAENFHPLVKRKPFQLGVRAKLKVAVPSSVQVDATIVRGGQSADLGHHSLIDNGLRRVRFALKPPLDNLQHGDKVTLNMHVVATPLAAGCTGAVTQDISLKTKVINVQTSLLLP